MLLVFHCMHIFMKLWVKRLRVGEESIGIGTPEIQAFFSIGRE